MKTLASTAKKPTLETVIQAIASLTQEVREGFKDVQETVEFLKDNAVMRSEFEEGMQRLENKIVDHVDHFVKLHKKQEVELVSLSHRMDRHEDTFHKKP